MGLKMKESILQQEPFHATARDTVETDVEAVVEDLVKGARRFGTFLSQSVSKSAGMVAEG
jgi:hypothetical protein